MSKLMMVTVALGLIAGVGWAHDGPFKPEFQNQQVRVGRVRLEPHQKIPMHEIPPHVAVWLTDADLKVTYPDGRSEVRHFHAGETLWVALGKHAGENVGARPMEFVAIEPTSTPSSR